jgi:hypothetical protein
VWNAEIKLYKIGKKLVCGFRCKKIRKLSLKSKMTLVASLFASAQTKRYPFTTYQGAETLYKYGFVISMRGLRLINDVTTSDRLVPTPTFLKIDPRLSGVSG